MFPVIMPATPKNRWSIFVNLPMNPATGAVIETSWVDNKLIFQDEEFSELAGSMERWYGVSIHFANSGLEDWRFTGTFQHETIQQALDAMKLTANFYYKIEGDQITIYEKK